jgi:hypothetical protein
MLASGGASGQALSSGDPCATNQPPKASFVVEGGGPGQPVTLRSTSADPEGRPLNSVRWYSSDPTFPSGVGGDQVTHTFPPGRHHITLVVRDDCDSMVTAEGFVEVAPPVATDSQAPPIAVKSGQKTVPVRRGAFTFVLNPFLEHVLCRLGFRTKRPVKVPKASARARRLSLGTRQLDLDPGEPTRVKIRLSRAARTVLARDGRLHLQAVIEATDDSGNKAFRVYPFAVKAARKPRS